MLRPFVNYNATITAEIENGVYTVTHWRTVMLRYNVHTNVIEDIRADYISQTSSSLLGKLVRNIDRLAVDRWLASANLPKYDALRIKRMLKHP